MSKPSIETLLWVGLGGFLGANARYLVNYWISARFGMGFPWGTLVINVTGGLLLAAFAGWFTRQVNMNPDVRLFFAVGFCGAYTTFSTYALDTVTLAQAGQLSASLLNLALNNGLCLLATVAGLALGSRL